MSKITRLSQPPNLYYVTDVVGPTVVTRTVSGKLYHDPELIRQFIV